jgi:hypothetical protein
MNAKFLNFSRLSAGFLMVSAATFAHHGTFVSYDSAHPVTMKGVVT